MNDARFDDLVASYGRELEVHCYRMLGSLADAADQTQEALLRAWRGIDGFEGRTSVRAWLYKIATNCCIDFLRARASRTLPSELGAAADPTAPLGEPPAEALWIDPCPAPLWQATPPSPAARFEAAESAQLAFVVALQHLPATQRAVLILREVLGWSAAEAAELLDTSVASVNSALQRARATLDARRGRRPGAAVTADLQPMLARYLEAWERSDLDALVALLHEDVVASMPPWPGWFHGRAAMATFLAPRLGPPGTRRLLPVACADDAGFAFYRRAPGGDAFEPFAIEVVRIEGGLVAEMHLFFDRALFARFGLPDRL